MYFFVFSQSIFCGNNIRNVEKRRKNPQSANDWGFFELRVKN